MSGFQLNAKVAKKVDLEVIPISLLKPVVNRNYFALINLLKKNTYLANQISFFYYQQLVGNASLLNNNKQSANVRVPWDSMYQDMTGKVLILSPYDQYQLYMWVTVNNTQNMATQSNFQFLLFSLGNYLTQLNTAQRTLNQKLNAQYYFPLGVNVKNNQQMKKFLTEWINIPTSPSNNPEPTPSNTVPSAPTITSITPSNQLLNVYFNPPTSDGGSYIVDYEYSINNGSTWVSSGTLMSPIIISGLTNGITYQVKIRAINAIGNGAVSNTVSGTPVSTIPSAPTILSITPNNQSLLVYFNAPSSDGGSSILNYQYSVDDGSNWSSSGSIISPIVISGLTNGISYPVVIRAINANGNGPNSNTVSGTPNASLVITSFTTTGPTTWTAPPYTTSIEYLVIGGGGGGGSAYDTGSGGGGGAGLMLYGTISVIPNFTYNLYVGAGGAGGIANRPVETNGVNGENSYFNSIIATGGSGGYASRSAPDGIGVGGVIANTGALTGGGGGNGGGSGGSTASAGGGGGNGSAGGTSVNNTPGSGGVGIVSTITGSAVLYGSGGIGGRDNVNANGVNAVANKGNGGGGASSVSFDSSNGGNGGSGIVILKYLQ